MKSFWAVLLAAVLIGSIVSQGEAEEMVIHNGSKVAFDYTLTVDGKVFDSSAGRTPLEYTQGDNQLLPGLTKKMEGLKVGEEKSIVIKPEEAYGMPNPAAFKEVPIKSLPADMKPEAGMMLQANDKNGQVFPVKISEVKKDSVIMDLNHPLSGKTLFFKVKIVSIK